MLFRVKNLGLIDEAEIQLDGITVITGENNVGKSTIGRMLYCVNNVFLRDSIEEVRIHRINNFIHRAFDKEINSINIYGTIQETDIVRKIVSESTDYLSGKVSLANSFKVILEEYSIERAELTFQALEKKILEFLKQDDRKMVEKLLKFAISTNFPKSVYNVYNGNNITKIKLKTKNSENYIEFNIVDDNVNVQYQNIVSKNQQVSLKSVRSNALHIQG